MSRNRGLGALPAGGWIPGRMFRHVAAGAAVMLAAACVASAGADPQQQAIERLIGGAACDDDSQCRTLPIGHKACGGPAAWLAWSTKVTDESQLRRLLAQPAEGTLAPPARPRGYSDCAFVPDPGAACRAGRCVLLHGAAAAR